MAAVNLIARQSRPRLLATLFICAASAATQSCGSSKSVGESCQNLDSYCGTHCVRDWATAQQAATWCVRGDGGTANNESVYIRTGCDGFNFVYLGGTDNGTYYYYDPQSGQLVGVGNAVGTPDGRFCRAGIGPTQPLWIQCGDSGATPVCGPSP